MVLRGSALAQAYSCDATSWRLTSELMSTACGNEMLNKADEDGTLLLPAALVPPLRREGIPTMQSAPFEFFAAQRNPS